MRPPSKTARRGRKPILGPSVGLALCLGLVVGGARLAQAQSPREATELEGPFEEEEKALYAEFQGRTPITTRRRTDDYLKTHPNSIVGHFVLGSVLREADGDLPRAMYHLGRARELYEGRWPTSEAHAEAPWRLHRELLFGIQQIAGELEQHEYRLTMLEFHDQLYDPNLAAERAWPLLRLGRIDEARAQAQKATESAGSVRRSMGRNALCAIEGHSADRRAWFDACVAAFDEAKRTSEVNDQPFMPPDQVTSVAVHAYNAALAARASLRPDEVERLARAGARRLEFTAANPWALLVRLFLGQGRGQEATQALVEAQRWRTRQPPALRDQIRADQDVLAASLLMVAGEGEAARGLVDRAVEHPDRRGLTVTTREHTVGAHALLRLAVRRTQVQLDNERRSYGEAERGWWAQIRHRSDEAYEAWVDEGRVQKALSKGDALERTLRLFVHGGLEPVPVWLLGDLAEVVGPGVMQAALGAVREEVELSGLEAYYQALSVDVAWAQGDEEATWQAADAALDALPTSEKLLRARVAARGGQAALDDGERAHGLELLETAMGLEPGVMRRLNLRLPCEVRVEGDSQDAQRAAELLEDSPRLVSQKGAFVIEVGDGAQGLELCLHGPSSAEMSCVTPEPAAPEAAVGDGTPLDPAVELARAFHETAFAMPLGLSAVDMGSLDGSATLSGDQSRRRLEQSLENLTRG